MLDTFYVRAMFRNLLKTRRLSRLTVVFLGLGMCVFTWGLQYKLSLYYPPHSSQSQVPEAKLLSKEEQPRIAANVPTEQHLKPYMESAPLHLAVLPLLWFGLSLLPRRRSFSREQTPWLLVSQASMNPFFFRPPPIYV